MINGYKILESGVIEKLEKNTFIYDKKYSQKYDSYGELSNYISYLRIGFIFGALGKYPDSILDVGYGNGSFLKCCSNIIKNCYGYDISDYPVPEKCYKVQNIKDFAYDVITFFDSLEHFQDPTFIKNLNCNFLCVSIPWCHYMGDDDWFKNWKHLRPEEHFWHFDKNSLIKFMAENNYEYILGGNLEDLIRKPDKDRENILTCIFKKI